jgi:hypothetical protein
MPASRPDRSLLLPVLLALAGISALAWLSLVDFMWTDYDGEARLPLGALLAGRFGYFAAHSPAYGGSLLMRAPFALVARLLGGGELAVYRALAVPALLAAGALAVWLAVQMRRAGCRRLAWVTALLLVAANPISMRALEFGHAEELVGAVLCVAAVIAAARGHWLAGSVAIGLAVASKPWALLAVPLVIGAAEGRRWRGLLVAGSVAFAFMAPFVLYDATHGGRQAVAGLGTGPIFQPSQVWWFLGDGPKHVVTGGGMTLDDYRTPPAWLDGSARPLLLAVALWRRRRPTLDDALLALAIVLLLRCLLDPWNIVYYAVPALFALAAWEGLVRREPPVLTLLATAMTWWTFQWLPGRASPDLRSLAYLAWSVPLVAGLTLHLFAPGTAARLGVLARRGRARPERPASPLGSTARTG